jgi:hypothetical protein
MAKEYDGQYKITVRWYPTSKTLESHLIQLHKVFKNAWKQEVVYNAYPGKQPAADDDLWMLDDPSEVTWLPKPHITNVDQLKEKTRQLTLKALFEYQERLFKNG